MDIELVERLAQESTREFVYRFLKTNMMRLTLAPGAALSEKEVADALQVSRTPVREAFIQLAQEGLLDVFPQRGTYVSLIDLDSVEESKFLRETLEIAVVKLACEHFPGEQLFELQSNIALQELCFKEKNSRKFFELDEELHRTIFTGCKKARIWAIMQQLHSHYNRVRMLNVASGHDLLVLLQHHQELVKAVREKNVELGIQTVRLHLNKVKVDIEDLMHDFGHYFKRK